MCAIVQNFVKIGQTISEISRFFDFQDGHRPPSWILKFSNFWVADRVRTTNEHRRTNFIKIGEMVAEISHLTTVK